MSTPTPSQRFSEINAQRLRRLEASVSGRQAERLRCLVFALHMGADPTGGSPRLTARGICGYQPEEQTLSAWLRQTGQPTGSGDDAEPLIRGLYVMGSSGTIDVVPVASVIQYQWSRCVR